MRKLLLLTILGFTFTSNAQTNINDARTNYSIGQTVTIKGVSANGNNQLGNIRYIQDATGGIPAYGVPTAFGGNIALGDSVTITGVLYDFNGLLEISPTNSFTVHGPVAAPIPLVVPMTSAGEPLEGRLLKFQNVTIGGTGNFAGNTNYTLTSGSNTFQMRVTSGSNLVGTPIPSGPVSVTGLLSQYNTDYQLLPRMTTDIVAYVAPATEINVKIGGVDVLLGGSYFVGNSANTVITIENSGASNLTVSSTSVTGANASEFTTNIPASSTVSATSQQNYNLSFVPTGNGTRVATLTINNDDPDESVYVIYLEGVGLDNLATEPLTNPSALTFTNVSSYTMNGTFPASATANAYIVLWKNGGTVTEVPVDGASYMRGDMIGGAKVAYVGSSTGFVPRGIIANQNYSFKVFAFNGQGAYTNYKTTTPASASVVSLGEQIGTYYNGINSQSSTFLTDLSALINPHTVVSYFNYKTTVMSVFEPRDTTNGQSYVVCAYSGEHKVYTDPFDWTATGYSREHTYAHSWMPSYPADSPALPEYSDVHNLYPTNNTQANGPRSNLPLDSITGNVVFTYLEGRVGYNGSQLVYEPRQVQKGNAARALLYMATCYNGISGANWKLPVTQGQVHLKAWHDNDAPDNYEIARNEYIFSLQNNRNPFVDSVHFACPINFTNMSYTACASTNELNELLEQNLTVFPVPSQNEVYIQVNGTTINSVEILDLTGKIVFSKNYNNNAVVELKNTGLSSGTYLVKVVTPYGSTAKRIIIE
jgi:endonuclease I/DNA/RNA endonuclease YhcR with UshA esterase domain